MSPIVKASAPTISYHAIKGSYGKVTYFMTKSALRDVAENLALAPQESLTFSERIQRKLNIRRVEEELLPYLKYNELRFFNSLVCIMLPDKDKKTGFWNFESYRDENGEELGGLGLLSVSKDVGRIVLDGQHRHAALKEYWTSIKDNPQAAAHQIEVALLFIVVEERGMMGAESSDLRQKILADGRNLFAVLNKTAVSVDKNTLLLVDDSDIRHVITRRLLEEKVLDDMHVKWMGSLNLNPTDPYFTVIQVVSDLVDYYLRDCPDVDEEYGTTQARDAAIKKLYNKTPLVGVPLVDFARVAIAEGKAMSSWLAGIGQLGIELVAQPMETKLTGVQRDGVKKMRTQELMFTVAGQKAAIRAMVDAFRLGRNQMADLQAIVRHFDALFEKGMYRRTHKNQQNPFLRVLFDTLGRMIPSESAVECARQILAVALGAPLNRDEVLKMYYSYTEQPSDIVKAFWEEAQASKP